MKQVLGVGWALGRASGRAMGRVGRGRCRGWSSVLVAASGASAPAFAQVTTDWVAPTSAPTLFQNPSAWSMGVPGPEDTARFAFTDVAVFSTGTVFIRNLDVLSTTGFFDFGGLTFRVDRSFEANATDGDTFLTFLNTPLTAGTLRAQGGPSSVRLEFAPSSPLNITGVGSGGGGTLVARGDNGDPAEIIIQGGLSGSLDIVAGDDGLVEVPSFTGQSEFPTASVLVEPGGIFRLGRNIGDTQQTQGFENFGTLVVGDEGVPTNLFIADGFTNGAPGPGTAGSDERGTVKLDILSPDGSAIDRLFLETAYFGGTLEICAAVPLSIQPGYDNSVISTAAPIESGFDVIITPRTGTDAFLDVITGRFSVDLLARRFPTGIAYANPLDFDLGGQASDAVTADFDGDGIDDVAAAIPFGGGPNGSVVVVFGQTDASNLFTGLSAPQTIASRGVTAPPRRTALLRGADTPTLVVALDFDGDGDQDIASYNEGDGTIEFQINDGFGNFTPDPGLTFTPLGTPVDLDKGQFVPNDMGGTDPEDLAVTATNGPGVAGNLALASSSGEGGVDICDIDTGADPDGSDPIDVDGAGVSTGPGLAVTSAETGNVEVFLNPGGAGLEMTPSITVKAGEAPTEVASGDLDTDGFPDLSVVSAGAGTVTILRNIPALAGGRTFAASPSIAASPSPASSPKSLVVVDVDEDGDRDLAFVTTESGVARGPGLSRVIQVIRNTSTGEGILVQEPEPLSGQDFSRIPDFIRVADFDLDRDDVPPFDDISVFTLTVPFSGNDSDGYVLISGDLGSTFCPADVNGDGSLTGADFNAWIAAFSQGLPIADQNGDGSLTGADFNAFLSNFSAGCP